MRFNRKHNTFTERNARLISAAKVVIKFEFYKLLFTFLCFAVLFFTFSLLPVFPAAFAFTSVLASTSFSSWGRVALGGVFGSFSQRFGQGQLLDALVDELLNLGESVHVVLIDECNSLAVAVGAGSAANAVYIVFAVVRNVVVDHH